MRRREGSREGATSCDRALHDVDVDENKITNRVLDHSIVLLASDSAINIAEEGCGHARLMLLDCRTKAVWQATKSAAQERGGANIICPGGYFCPEDVNNPSSYGPPQPCAAGYFCVSGSSAPTTCDFDDLLLKQPDEFLIPTASGQLITPRQSVFIMGQSLLGNYCPELSTSPTTNCADGRYRPNSTVTIICPSGSFCKEGAAELDGQYCPNSTVTIICPSGFFCKEGAAEPVDCGSFDPCDEGSDQPGVTFSAIIGIAFGMFVVWALYAGAFFFYKKLFHGIEPRVGIKFTVGLKLKGVYGDLTGDVFVNGKATSLLKFKDVVGLVPQDDIVHDDLTVPD
eukprot:gene4305-14416_t